MRSESGGRTSEQVLKRLSMISWVLILILDIETENTGHDIMAHNKRILSVQIGDSTKQELYYADAASHEDSLEAAKHRIHDLLDVGTLFSGYNIIGFDLPMLNQFLGIRIPEGNVYELCETSFVKGICSQKYRNTLRLEEICLHVGIKCRHKDEVNQKAEAYKNRPDLLAQARKAARDLVESKRWGLDFSLQYAIDKIAGGNAILDSYRSFARSNNPKNTSFYRYAIGDVICEHELLKRVGNPPPS